MTSPKPDLGKLTGPQERCLLTNSPWAAFKISHGTGASVLQPELQRPLTPQSACSEQGLQVTNRCLRVPLPLSFPTPFFGLVRPYRSTFSPRNVNQKFLCLLDQNALRTNALGGLFFLPEDPGSSITF